MTLPAITNAAYEMHFLVGLLIALLGGRRWLIICLALAIGKEIADFFYHGQPDVLDIVFTLFGGITYKLVEWKRNISHS